MQALPIPKKANSPREAVTLREGYGGGYRALLLLLVAAVLLVAVFAVGGVLMQADGAWIGRDGGGGLFSEAETESADESEGETEDDGLAESETLPEHEEPEGEELPPDGGIPEGATPIRDADLSCLPLGAHYLHNETAYRPSTAELLLREIAPQDREDGITVLVLHTHASEAYLPAGTEYITSPMGDLSYSEDPLRGVIAVGEILCQTLRQEGITVLHCTVMQESSTLLGAYERAKETVQDYLARYPGIDCVIDLHRDSVRDGEGAYLRTLATGTEKPTAQLLCVVGTDGNGTVCPNWQDNLALALRLRNKLNADGCAVMRPVSLRNASYNQELAPLSILLEVGSDANSPEEASRAAILAARAIAELLRGE